MPTTAADAAQALHAAEQAYAEARSHSHVDTSDIRDTRQALYDARATHNAVQRGDLGHDYDDGYDYDDGGCPGHDTTRHSIGSTYYCDGTCRDLHDLPHTPLRPRPHHLRRLRPVIDDSHHHHGDHPMTDDIHADAAKIRARIEARATDAAFAAAATHGHGQVWIIETERAKIAASTTHHATLDVIARKTTLVSSAVAVLTDALDHWATVCAVDLRRADDAIRLLTRAREAEREAADMIDQGHPDDAPAENATTLQDQAQAILNDLPR